MKIEANAFDERAVLNLVYELALRGRFPTPRYLETVEAALDKLAMDPGRTPGGIRAMHFQDELPDLRSMRDRPSDRERLFQRQ